MQTIHIENTTVVKQPKTVVGIGVFDGLHLGHQMLLNKVKKRAEAISVTASALTFAPHPRQVLRPASELQLLYSVEERLQFFEAFGLDTAYVALFTHAFSSQTPECFIQNILKGIINAEEVVIGENFRFGAGKQGTAKFLQEQGNNYNLKVHIVKSVSTINSILSSTQVRAFLKAGQIREANEILGRPYTIYGRIIKRYPNSSNREVSQHIEIELERRSALAEGAYTGSLQIQRSQYFEVVCTITQSSPSFPQGRCFLEFFPESQFTNYLGKITVHLISRLDACSFGPVEGAKEHCYDDPE